MAVALDRAGRRASLGLTARVGGLGAILGRVPGLGLGYRCQDPHGIVLKSKARLQGLLHGVTPSVLVGRWLYCRCSSADVRM